MKKVLLSLLFVFTLTLSTVLASSIDFITDNLDFLTDEQAQQLQNKAQDIYNQYGIEIYCTIDDYANLSETSQAVGQGSITLNVDEDHDGHVMMNGITAIEFTDDDIELLGKAYYGKTSVYDRIADFMDEAKWLLDWHDIHLEANQQLVSNPTSVTQELNTNYIVDEAGVISESQRQSLQATLTEINNRHDVNIVIVTVNSIGNYTVEQYADDYYDYHNYKQDGAILLIDMGSRSWYISTKGTCAYAFNDDGLEYLENQISEYLGTDFAKTFGVFASECDNLLTQAENGDPYIAPPKEKASLLSVLLTTGPISLILGFIGAKFKVGGLQRQLKSVKSKHEANSYVRSHSLNLTENRDLFLYNTVTKTPRPKDTGTRSGPGGRSTMHTSSSGASHGGRGGRF